MFSIDSLREIVEKQPLARPDPYDPPSPPLSAFLPPPVNGQASEASGQEGQYAPAQSASYLQQQSGHSKLLYKEQVESKSSQPEVADENEDEGLPYATDNVDENGKSMLVYSRAVQLPDVTRPFTDQRANNGAQDNFNTQEIYRKPVSYEDDKQDQVQIEYQPSPPAQTVEYQPAPNVQYQSQAAQYQPQHEQYVSQPNQYQQSSVEQYQSQSSQYQQPAVDQYQQPKVDQYRIQSDQYQQSQVDQYQQPKVEQYQQPAVEQYQIQPNQYQQPPVEQYQPQTVNVQSSVELASEKRPLDGTYNNYNDNREYSQELSPQSGYKQNVELANGPQHIEYGGFMPIKGSSPSLPKYYEYNAEKAPQKAPYDIVEPPKSYYDQPSQQSSYSDNYSGQQGGLSVHHIDGDEYQTNEYQPQGYHQNNNNQRYRTLYGKEVSNKLNELGINENELYGTVNKILQKSNGGPSSYRKPNLGKYWSRPYMPKVNMYRSPPKNRRPKPYMEGKNRLMTNQIGDNFDFSKYWNNNSGNNSSSGWDFAKQTN